MAYSKQSHSKREEWGIEGGMGPKQDQNPAEKTLNHIAPYPASEADCGMM
jgi:hypothetical protein